MNRTNNQRSLNLIKYFLIISLVFMSSAMTTFSSEVSAEEAINLFTPVDNGTFGIGSGAEESSTLPDGVTSFIYGNEQSYSKTIYPPSDGEYVVSTRRETPNTVEQNNPPENVNGVDLYTNEGGFYSWHRLSGHTTGDATDKFLVVNSSTDDSGEIVFSQSVSGLDTNRDHTFGIWLMNLIDKDVIDLADPNVSILINLEGVDDNENGTIDEAGENKVYFSTGVIEQTNDPIWMPYQFTFNTRNSSKATFSIRNNNVLRDGNDLAIDDITLFAGPEPVASIPGRIQGTLYNDVDKDESFDISKDTVLPNVTVTLKSPNGDVIQTIETSVNGTYAFLNLSAGNYTVEYDIADTDIPDGIIATSNASVEVQVELDSISEVDFRVAPGTPVVVEESENQDPDLTEEPTDIEVENPIPEAEVIVLPDGVEENTNQNQTPITEVQQGNTPTNTQNGPVLLRTGGEQSASAAFMAIIIGLMVGMFAIIDFKSEDI